MVWCLIMHRVNFMMLLYYSNIFNTCSKISVKTEYFAIFTFLTERSGRNADPSPPSSAEVKNRAELYLYSP